ncbi:MAG: NusA-like transcription termination signal-binding factor [Candidatus Aenigmatarchaeota archaeon]
MRITLDKNTIQLMNLFHNLTGSSVIDCIQENNDVYFVVAKGQYGLSVGKNGIKIKNAEKIIKKNIRIFEYSEDVKTFVKNAIPEIQEIDINKNVVSIKLKQNDKPRVIGKNGKNIKIISKILERLFGIKAIKIK